jgi:hypothetical protein
MNVILAGIIFAVVLSAGILVLLEIRRRIGVRQLAEEGESASKGLGAIEGAIFGSLGLILAFSFSGGTYLMRAGISLSRKRMTSALPGCGSLCSRRTHKSWSLLPWHDVIWRLLGGINPPTPPVRIVVGSRWQLEIERIPVGIKYQVKQELFPTNLRG